MIGSKKVILNKDFFTGPVSSAYKKALQEMPENTVRAEDWKYLAIPGYFLQLLTFQNKPLRLDDFQMAVVNSRSKLNITTKARQLGYSTICVAGRSLAKSYIYPRFKSIICSYNLVEAREKIKIAKELNIGVPSEISMKLREDNQLGMTFQNGSTIYSVFSPRGHNNCDLYLDEFAFCEDQQGIYREAFPIVERQVDKQLFIGSTPFGKTGLFYDIFSGAEGKYQGYNKFLWYWWDSPFYCKDVRNARWGKNPAHLMPTHKRVKEYGTHALKEIFANILLEDFQQEYEGYFCDEATSFFPYELITSRMGWYDFELQEAYPKILPEIFSWIKGRLYAGFDVGRTTNTSEFYVFDVRKEGGQQKIIQVFDASFNNVEFEKQEGFLRDFLKMYEDYVESLQIDQNQIGRNLAENLVRDFPHVVTGIDMTAEQKERMAVNTKIKMVNGQLELFPSREMISHFHAIKQIYSPGMRCTKFDADRNAKHHADKFWGAALAIGAVDTDRKLRSEVFFGG